MRQCNGNAASTEKPAHRFGARGRAFHFGSRNWFTLSGITHQNLKENPLATPNYSFEKRQRDLAKKKKKEEKLKKKSGPAGPAPAENPAPPADDGKSDS